MNKLLGFLIFFTLTLHATIVYDPLNNRLMYIPNNIGGGGGSGGGTYTADEVTLTKVGTEFQAKTTKMQTRENASSGVDISCRSLTASSTVYVCASNGNALSGPLVDQMEYHFIPDVLSGTNPTLTIDGIGPYGVYESDCATSAVLAPGKQINLWYKLSTTRFCKVAAPVIRPLTFSVDNGASVITAGIKHFMISPYNCLIIDWSALGYPNGTISAEIWKSSSAFPIGADSIVAAAPVGLTASQRVINQPPTGWIKSVSKGDALLLNVTGTPTNTTKFSVVVSCQEN